jgi:hypothetical protein
MTMWWIIGIIALIVVAIVTLAIVTKFETANEEQRPADDEADEVEVVRVADSEGLGVVVPWARSVVEDGDQEIAIRRRPVVADAEILPDYKYLYDNPPASPAQDCAPAPDLGDHHVYDLPPDPTPSSTDSDGGSG